MKIRALFLVSVIGAAAAAATSGSANAQAMSDQMRRGMMSRGTDEDRAEGMMMCPMMQSGMMRHNMTQGGMMQNGMMGSAMMGNGMAALLGSRVTPMMNLSVEDVRGYLAARLERLNNKRLKIGEIKSDDASITADIVTVDNSLVQRLKVDRHTGAVTYEN